MDRRSFLSQGGLAAIGLALVPMRGFAQRAGAAAGPADAKLSALLDDVFAQMVRRYPELATSLGLDKGANAALKAKLTDNSLAASKADFATVQGWQGQLRAIGEAGLSPGARINYEVIDYQFTDQTVGGAKFDFVNPSGPYQITQLTGAYAGVPDFLDSQHTIETAADAEAYLARLGAFTTQLDNDADEARRLQAKGIVPPDFVLDLTLAQLTALRGKPAGPTVLVQSIVRRAKEKNLPGDWGARAEKIVSAQIFPALDRQLALIKAQRGGAVGTAGIWRLPQGDAMYAQALASATTTTMPPQAVHELGLHQVDEISAQIDTLLKGQGMAAGSVGERLTALNKDPKQLFANDDAGRQALLDQLNRQVADMTARLPKAFATLPKAKLIIKRVPEFIQDGAPNGYYQGAALDGSRPAIYYINLKDTADWPKYGLPTLTYHEGVPGHHLQISLAQESPNIPMIRKLSPFSAYTEGWALYAEQLAGELGAYEGDPFGQVGFLQSFLFRATRLVVDTGMHYKRWTRAQATDYMVQKTGFAVPRTQREIDRYCVWPGQACSYKVGHMRWVAARERAKAKLGARFDLRQFHQVLLDGSVPLVLLDRLIDAKLA